MFAVAAVVRMIGLGEAAFRADTLHFYQWAQAGYSFGSIWSQWTRIMADTAQFPLPAALAVGLSDLLPVAPGAFTIRLADALFGALAVVFGALIAREFGGKPLMLAAAALWVVSPFHLQLSREAYFYSTLVAGSAILVWAVVVYARRMNGSRRLPPVFMVLVILGFLLSAYSHFTGWIMAAFAGGTLIVLAWRRGKRLGRPLEAIVLVLVAGGLALPLLFLPWALPYFLKDIGNPEAKAESIRVMGEVTEPMLSILWRYLLTMGWGSWSIGMVILLIALAGSVVYAVRGRRRVVRVAWLVMGLCLGAYLLIMKTRGLYVAVRHISFLYPVFFSLMILGLWRVGAWAGRFRRPASYALMAGAFLLLAYPGSLVLRLSGYPTPYRDIKTWFDASLPPGTPVLVDRWFEPWNELTIYPTTNVVFTFTGPNEPLDVFLSTRWRDQAQDFFLRHPDAAYLEIAKSFWENPEVGPWDWPRTYFSRQVSISNSAGLALREFGLAYREDFYAANSNRVVVEVFYNTREDILERHRAEGRAVTLFFGSGFFYEKSGPVGFLRFQTQQFMDWRVLEQRGQLEVYNLTDEPREVALRIAALSPRGPKLVSAGGGVKHQFSGPQIQRWNLGPVTLAPGLTLLTLEDPLWDRAMNPLLIAQVDVVTAD
ncbi:MAG TPA: hypothetical protein PKA51_03235 [Kiritimatiellia bacterium]|nr:hypothetical protein [Kiritimatiellia bacterium]